MLGSGLALPVARVARGDFTEIRECFYRNIHGGKWCWTGGHWVMPADSRMWLVGKGLSWDPE